MKNKIMAVTFILLMYDIGYGQTTNYLDDGGFEMGKADINMTGSPPFTTTNRVSIPACLPQSTGAAGDATQINSNGPGGYGSVQYKMYHWGCRGSYSYNCDDNCLCSDCEPHIADWIYNNPNWVLGPTNSSFSGEAVTPGIYAHNYNTPSGSNLGCVGMNPYEMVQEVLRKKITISGLYYISGYVTKRNNDNYGPSTAYYADPRPSAQFIFSNQQPDYVGSSCTDWADPSPDYGKLKNISYPGSDNISSIPISMTDNSFVDWEYIEVPVYLTKPNMNWFSINVALADGVVMHENQAPYFAFDDFYISDEICYCPIFKLIQNTSLNSQLVKAQEYIRAGKNVGLANAGIGNVVITALSGGSLPHQNRVTFRAGSFISLEPGFEVKTGAVFETELRGCGSPSGIITNVLPNAYTPNCDGINDQFCFFPTNASTYSIDIYDSWGRLFATLSGQIPLGMSPVCVDIPLEYATEDIYLAFIHLSNCGEETLDQSGTIFISASEGCYPMAKRNDLIVDTSFVNLQTSTRREQQKTMKTYPDPACDYITIQVSDVSADDKITISGADGRIVYSNDVISKQMSLSLENLSNGFYIITYTSSDGSILSSKFSKLCQH